MPRGNGLTWALLSAAAVLGVLAVFRIPTKGSHELTREEIFGKGAAVAPALEPPNSPEHVALLERIVASWKKRQKQAAKFHFVWDSRVTKPEVDANVAVPPSGWWQDGDARFREDSLLIDYDDNGLWRQIAGVRLIHDGDLNSRLTVPHGTGGPPWVTIWHGPPNGANRRSPRMLLLNNHWEFLPLLFAVRPLNSAVSPTARVCRVVNEDAVADGVHCVEIHTVDAGQSESYWIDPKRDDVVVRWEGGVLGVSIDYQHDPKHGWLPSRWSWSRRDYTPPGPLPEESERKRKARNDKHLLFDATVRNYSIGEPLPATVFAQSYPANTVVNDVTAGSEEDWKRQQAAAKAIASEALQRRNRPQNVSAEEPAVSKEDRATLDAIAAAWAKRRAKIHSFQITWRRNLWWNSNGWRQGPFAMSCMACGEGARFAFEDHITGAKPVDPASKPAWIPGFDKTAFDGAESRGVHPGTAWVQTGFSRADIGPDDENAWLAVCPWDARFTRLDPARLRVIARETKLGGANCVMVLADWMTYYWLDRDRDFIVLRKQEVGNGVDGTRADFSYRADASFGWLPTAWHMTRLGAEYNLGTVHDDVVQEVIVNRPIHASTFAVEFPVLARVNDLDPEPFRESRARSRAAETIAERWARPPEAEMRLRSPYDPQFDARVDLEKALKEARELKRRVLIEFGGQESPEGAKLHEALTRNEEIAALMKKNFVLLLIDTDYRDAGQIVFNQYVSERKQGPLPLLLVMAPDETVLDTTDPASFKSASSKTGALKASDIYAVDRLKAYLEKWAPKK
jgi:hypothetical protein